jgi:hypothetical protein
VGRGKKEVKLLMKRKRYVEPKLCKSEKSLVKITLGPFCSTNIQHWCDRDDVESITNGRFRG